MHASRSSIPMDMHNIAQNEKDKEKIAGMGFVNVSCFEAENMLMGQVLITKVPARHGDNDYTAEHMGEGSGYPMKRPYISPEIPCIMKVSEIRSKHIIPMSSS